jgi:hypothetical protein
MVHTESAARWTRPDEYPLSSLRTIRRDTLIEALSIYTLGRRMHVHVIC